MAGAFSHNSMHFIRIVNDSIKSVTNCVKNSPQHNCQLFIFGSHSTKESELNNLIKDTGSPYYRLLEKYFVQEI